jgi:hypothetical protein
MRQWMLLTAAALVVLLAASRAAPAAEEPALAAKADAVSDTAYTERLKEIRLIEMKYLRSNDEKTFQAGREKLLAIDDPAAVKPMVHVLYGENVRYRGLLLEGLTVAANRGSKLARAYLQEVAVGDSNAANRRRAVDNIKGLSGDPATDRLMAHVAQDKVPVLRDRAATALATLDEKRAIWLLVEQLVTQETRVAGAEVRDAQVALDLRLQMASLDTSINPTGFQTYQITAAVPNGGIAAFTIELPRVNVVDVSTTMSMADRSVQPTVQRVQVQHPEILAALKTLTRKDFGYNQAAWQQWLQSPEAAKLIPAWELFKAAGK